MSTKTFWRYWQRTPKSQWIPERAEDCLAKVADEGAPFYTVLATDYSADESENPDAEELLKARYYGPWYIDWDGEIDDVLDSVRSFIGKLETDLGIAKQDMRFWLTGGRGVHFEMPQAAFIEGADRKPAAVGALPLVYRAMTEYYDGPHSGMDLRIYSLKRGRMWRTPNIERVNAAGDPAGAYKVPIPTEALLLLTPEQYRDYCSTPRTLDWRTPQFYPALSLLYHNCLQAEERRLKKRIQNSRSKQDEKLKALWQDKYPPWALELLRGENLNPDKGFNQISMQLVVLTLALGKTRDDLLTASAGLIQTYRGDRHRTPKSVERALLGMFDYLSSNSLYDYSDAGVRSIMADPDRLTDPEVSSVDFNTVQPDVAELDDVPNIAQLIFSKSAVQAYGKDGAAETLMPAAFDVANTMRLVDEDGVARGWQTRLREPNGPLREVTITTSDLTSPSEFGRLMASHGVVCSAMTQQHNAALSQAFNKAARGNQVFSVRKEGLNFLPLNLTGGKLIAVWADDVGVVDKETLDGKQPNLKVKFNPIEPQLATHSHLGHIREEFSADNADDAATMEALLRFNADTFAVAIILGWMVAAVQRPFFTAATGGRFPALYVYGEAGTGKTSTVQMFGRGIVVSGRGIRSASLVGNSTEHGLVSLLDTTASLPILLDEFGKKGVGGRGNVEGLGERLIHAAYDEANESIKGAMHGRDRFTVKKATAPLVLTGEVPPTDTYLRERSVFAPLRKIGTLGRRAYWDRLNSESGKRSLNRLFAAIVKDLLTCDPLEYVEALKSESRRFSESMRRHRFSDRMAENASIPALGLMYLRDLLQATFGDRFDEQLDLLSGSLELETNYRDVRPQSEVVQVLLSMVMLSQGSWAEDLSKGIHAKEHYILGQDYVEVDVRSAYSRYMLYMRTTGQQCHFQNAESFSQMLVRDDCILDTICLDSPLRGSDNLKPVYRLSLERLAEQGVGRFGG